MKQELTQPLSDSMSGGPLLTADCYARPRRCNADTHTQHYRQIYNRHKGSNIRRRQKTGKPTTKTTDMHSKLEGKQKKVKNKGHHLSTLRFYVSGHLLKNLR